MQVKQNSIQGCKLNNVSIVYTPWANLRKTASMEVGQVRCPATQAGGAVKVVSISQANELWPGTQ